MTPKKKKDGEDDGAETATAAGGKKNLQIFAKGDETPKVIIHRMVLVLLSMG